MVCGRLTSGITSLLLGDNNKLLAELALRGYMNRATYGASCHPHTYNSRGGQQEQGGCCLKFLWAGLLRHTTTYNATTWMAGGRPRNSCWSLLFLSTTDTQGALCFARVLYCLESFCYFLSFHDAKNWQRTTTPSDTTRAQHTTRPAIHP